MTIICIGLSTYSILITFFYVKKSMESDYRFKRMIVLREHIQKLNETKV